MLFVYFIHLYSTNVALHDSHIKIMIYLIISFGAAL